MALFATINVKREFKQTEIYEHIKGTIDPYGNPFEIIQLIYNSKIGRAPSKTQGFEDLFVTINEGELGPVIAYRGLGKGESGTMDFIRNDFGILEAYVPKTPHNVKKIASLFYSEMFYVKDPKQRLEIKAIADEMLEHRTQEQIAFDNKILADSKRTPLDDSPFKPTNPAVEKKLDKEDNALLQKQNADLLKMNQELMAELTKKDKKAPELPENEKKRLEKEFDFLKNKAEEFGKVVPKGTSLGALRKIVDELPNTTPEGSVNDNQRNANVLSGKE